MKMCSKCHIERSAESFSKDRSKKDGLHPVCKLCHKLTYSIHRADPVVRERSKLASKRWRNLNPERNRRLIRCATLRKKYGISADTFDVMFAAQNSQCAICSGSASKGNGVMHVDHNHTTGKVRGILCQACNTTLGKMQDSPALLRKAADYLENNN